MKVLFGASGHAKVILDILNKNGESVEYILDDNPRYSSLLGVKVKVFQDQNLGIIIAVALIINLVVAALAGALLPSFLRSIRIDPAIAGTVVLTTITDVVGFLSFLSLATWFYA